MVRTGLLRSLITSLSRLVLVLWLRFLGSQAPRPLFSSNYNISWPYGFVRASRSAGYQSGLVRVGRP